jgi:hypothetical protein
MATDIPERSAVIFIEKRKVFAVLGRAIVGIVGVMVLLSGSGIRQLEPKSKEKLY